MIDSKDHQHISADYKKDVRQRSQTLIAQISSPLPPPEMLLAYERAQPGLINKIIEMTERESEHRRDLEKNKLQAEMSSLQRGDLLISKAQVFAFSLSVVAIVVGGVAGILGAQITGSIIGTSGVVGIIVAFIENSKREK